MQKGLKIGLGVTAVLVLAVGVRIGLIYKANHEDVPVKKDPYADIKVDPDDNVFIECADAARADYLITGSQRHFPQFWKKTKIITSREFIGITAPHLIS